MSEPLFKDGPTDDDESSKHDGFDVFGSIFGKLNIWTAFLIFIIFVLMNTNFFIDEIMKKMSSDFVLLDGNLSSSGIIVQGVMLSLSYLIIDLLVTGGIL